GQRRPAAARWRRALRIGAHGVRGDAWQRGGGGRARGRRRAAAGRGAGRPHARGGAGGAGGSGARPTAAPDDSPRAVPCAPDPLPAPVMTLHWTSAVEAAGLVRDGIFTRAVLSWHLGAGGIKLGVELLSPLGQWSGRGEAVRYFIRRSADGGRG